MNVFCCLQVDDVCHQVICQGRVRKYLQYTENKRNRINNKSGKTKQ